MESIHTRIKTLRNRKELSMEALAAIIGVKWQTIQQWERQDGTAPKRTRLDAVAKALDTTPDYLLFGETSGPKIQQLTEPYQTRRRDPLIDRLLDLACQIDKTGLQALIEVAECFIKSHPAQKAKAS